MPGHAEDIVNDYFEGDEWAELDDADTEPESELPSLPHAARESGRGLFEHS